MRQFTVNSNAPTAAVRNVSGFASFYADGTFDGTASVQASPDGATWFDLPDSGLSAPGVMNLNVDALYLRVVNSGAAPSLNVWLSGR